MNHLTTVHSTPLDHTRTSEVCNLVPTGKSKPGASLFSLKDKLRTLRQKSTQSPSTTHHVKLNGLKPDRPVRGTIHFFHLHRTRLTRPLQTRHKTGHNKMEILYMRLRSEMFVPGGCSIRPVSAFAISVLRRLLFWWTSTMTTASSRHPDDAPQLYYPFPVSFCLIYLY